MNENILEEAKKFLVSYLKDKNIGYQEMHSWRDNWEFVVLHSLRVEGYVRRILDSENHALTDEEILMARLAAILHDIGRINTREAHGLIGRDIVYEWLRENQAISDSIKDIDRLLYMIEKHSDKEEVEEDFCLKILRDADVLDEIGVLSIFMASNRIDKSNPYFFKLLLDRLEDYEISFCDKGFNLLNTESAKVILKQKKDFIIHFNQQLKDEICGTEMFGEINIEDYFLDYNKETK